MNRCLTLGMIATALTACADTGSMGMVEWPAYGGDAGGQKYSPLTDINRGNVDRLTLAWTWETGEQPIRDTDSTKAARPGMFQSTPIMVNDNVIDFTFERHGLTRG